MARNGNLMDVDLQEQVAALRKDLGALKRAVARRGSSFYENAGDTVSDYFSELSERFVPSMSGVRRQARYAGRMAYDHPAVVATVGLIVVGLVASLLLGGRFTTSEPTREETAGPSRRRGRSRST
jgi:hypothetical protein